MFRFKWSCVSLVIFAGLVACEDHEKARSIALVPLATADEGRLRLWSSCPKTISVELSAEIVRDPAIRGAVEQAVTAWQVSGIPLLELKDGTSRPSNEDGHSTINLSVLHQCARGQTPGNGCADGHWDAVTALYGRPAGTYFETVEADINVNLRVKKDPSKLTAILIHEIGHFYGLDHLGQPLPSDESVMGTEPDGAVKKPGRLDVKRLQHAYSRACSTGN